MSLSVAASALILTRLDQGAPCYKRARVSVQSNSAILSELKRNNYSMQGSVLRRMPRICLKRTTPEEFDTDIDPYRSSVYSSRCIYHREAGTRKPSSSTVSIGRAIAWNFLARDSSCGY